MSMGGSSDENTGRPENMRVWRATSAELDSELTAGSDHCETCHDLPNVVSPRTRKNTNWNYVAYSD